MECHVAAVLALSLTLAVLVVMSGGKGLALSRGTLPDSTLSFFCWAMVVAGITGTALASAGNRYGWLLLFGLQPLWITYACCTGQTGLILGSLAYGAAQLNGLRVSWTLTGAADAKPDLLPVTAGKKTGASQARSRSRRDPVTLIPMPVITASQTNV
jgi:hypothetical protein